MPHAPLLASERARPWTWITDLRMRVLSVKVVRSFARRGCLPGRRLLLLPLPTQTLIQTLSVLSLTLRYWEDGERKAEPPMVWIHRLNWEAGPGKRRSPRPELQNSRGSPGGTPKSSERVVSLPTHSSGRRSLYLASVHSGTRSLVSLLCWL